jgi:rhodanese-related sulfurtransferase
MDTPIDPDDMDEAELDEALAAIRRISPIEAHAAADTGQAVLIDVRDASAYTKAHIKGARSLPKAVLDATRGDLPAGTMPPRGRLLILYCA